MLRNILDQYVLWVYLVKCDEHIFVVFFIYDNISILLLIIMIY